MPQDTKRVFWKSKTCSRTFFYLLNREFGYLKEAEELAADPLAGGIMSKGHQCGMLWGAALAVGAESFRRHEDLSEAITAAITATQRLMESFSDRTGTDSCREITGCDFYSKISMAKYFLTGKVFSCYNLAEKWAPEAIQVASEGLSHEHPALSHQSMSCASEVVRKMGGSNEEMAMVAGFAGGLGLSGHACGALSAAIWMNSLDWCRKHPSKTAYSNPNATATLAAFDAATGSEILCHKICGQHFKTIDEHAEFIINGGCNKLINALTLA
ncbi:C-GCAxxG-C-C family (seleno)protein [Pseudomonadota bacterium]